MRKAVLVPLLLLSSWSATVTAQTSEFEIKTLAKDMEKSLEGCPRREIVTEFDQKHHKQVWQKQAWGPPSDVFADVKANDSILYPYILTIEFSLIYTHGPERQSKAEAEADQNLSPFVTPLISLQRGKYRNIYLAGKDGVHLKTRELLHENLDGTPGSWQERPSWSDACWDQAAPTPKD